MKLSLEDFQRYSTEPLNDDWMRTKYRIPDTRYYTVSVWPLPGELRVERERAVRAVKISKSDATHA